jgi:hypothetical protein
MVGQSHVNPFENVRPNALTYRYPVSNVFDCHVFLTTLVEQLNAKEVIAVKVPGQVRYAVASHEYSRSSPEFFEGMKLYLKHYYSIDLLSATDFADQPD